MKKIFRGIRLRMGITHRCLRPVLLTKVEQEKIAYAELRAFFREMGMDISHLSNSEIDTRLKEANMFLSATGFTAAELGNLIRMEIDNEEPTRL